MTSPALSAQRIYAAIAILGVSACAATKSDAPPAPAQAAPAPAGGAGAAVVDAGSPIKTMESEKKKGGSASCNAGTSGPDGKGH